MQKIGIGYEDYKRIIDDGCYYVDKTLLIKDIIEKEDKQCFGVCSNNRMS